MVWCTFIKVTITPNSWFLLFVPKNRCNISEAPSMISDGEQKPKQALPDCGLVANFISIKQKPVVGLAQISNPHWQITRLWTGRKFHIHKTKTSCGTGANFKSPLANASSYAGGVFFLLK